MWKSYGKEWQEKLKNERCFAKFLCRGCGKQKVNSDFLRKKFPREIVETSVDLRHDGLTLEKTRKRVSKIYGRLVKSATTIYNWAKDCARKFTGVIKGLGKRLHADETKLKTAKKGVYFWFWAMKDPVTKAIGGWHVSESRDMEETKLFLWECRRHFEVGYLPKSIRTDKMPAYRSAIHTVFEYAVKSERVISFKHGNNIIETFWRCKNNFPKFKTLKSARIFIAHWIAEYNSEKLRNWLISIIRRMKIIHFFWQFCAI